MPLSIAETSGAVLSDAEGQKRSSSKRPEIAALRMLLATANEEFPLTIFDVIDCFCDLHTKKNHPDLSILKSILSMLSRDREDKELQGIRFLCDAGILTRNNVGKIKTAWVKKKDRSFEAFVSVLEEFQNHKILTQANFDIITAASGYGYGYGDLEINTAKANVCFKEFVIKKALYEYDIKKKVVATFARSSKYKSITEVVR